MVDSVWTKSLCIAYYQCMKQPAHLAIKRGFVNFFGGFGYFTIALQLLVVALAYFGWLKGFMDATMPIPQQPPEEAPVAPLPSTVAEPSFLSITFTVVVLLFCIAIVVYGILKTPQVISRTGSKVVKKTAASTAPLALHAQKKQDTPRNRKKISAKLIVGIKLIFTVLPLIAVAISQFFSASDFSYDALIWSSAVLFCVSILSFGVQYLAAFLFKVPSRSLL